MVAMVTVVLLLFIIYVVYESVAVVHMPQSPSLSSHGRNRTELLRFQLETLWCKRGRRHERSQEEERNQKEKDSKVPNATKDRNVVKR